MSASVTGEQFIRTIRGYLEAHKYKLLSSQHNFNIITKNVTEKGPELINEENGNGFIKSITSWGRTDKAETKRSSSQTTTSSRPNSIVNSFPYKQLPNEAVLSNVPYMPIGSSLPLDIHYLYFLLVQFEYIGLEETHLPVPEHGLVETETTGTAGTAPSIATSINSVMSTLSISTGWDIWSKSNQQERPLHEDILYIHKYFTKITALKLNMNLDTHNGVARSGQRTIRGYERPLDGSLALPLFCFKSLTYLELNHIPFNYVDNWSALSQNLVSLVIKTGSLGNAIDVIGDRDWPKLKMLSLTDNSLTTLEPQFTERIRSLTHLNVSSNLLNDVPSALSTLYNMTSLNISTNMISTIAGINTVLGNIQELDLRNNRLTILAGLDRLYSLERLDIRDNRINEAEEIGRLNSLPNICEIWVVGNPFANPQSTYRVDIFSMFTNSDNEIALDGATPNFYERRKIEDMSFTTNPTPSAIIKNDDKGKNIQKVPRKDARVVLDIPTEDSPKSKTVTGSRKHHGHRVPDLKNVANLNQIPSVRRKQSVKNKIKAEKEVKDDTIADQDPRKLYTNMRDEVGQDWLRVYQEKVNLH